MTAANSATISARDGHRLVLLAASPTAPLAAKALARHLNIPAGQALDRLTRGPGVLAEGLEPTQAAQLAALLMALGLRVRCYSGADPGTPRGLPDLSLQLASGADPLRMAQALAQVLGRDPAAVLADLYRPGGVILTTPQPELAERLRRLMRRQKGLQLASSCPDQAVYDLFGGNISTRPQRRDLGRHLRLLGLQPCHFSGALAAGLDRRMLDHLLHRFAPAGVFGLNRAFQRFDLFLTASREMGPRALRDFLTTRQVGGDTEALQAAPMRIDTGLSHSAARQFQGDYDLIGLETFARLQLPAQNP